MWLFLSRRLQVVVAALLLLTGARLAQPADGSSTTEVRGALSRGPGAQIAPDRS